MVLFRFGLGVGVQKRVRLLALLAFYRLSRSEGMMPDCVCVCVGTEYRREGGREKRERERKRSVCRLPSFRSTQPPQPSYFSLLFSSLSSTDGDSPRA